MGLEDIMTQGKPIQPQKPLITKEQVAEQFNNAKQISEVSPVCMGIYGDDGTGKSGVVMDCRTEEEKKEGKKIIIIDFDRSNIPLKMAYHGNDPNILIMDPMRTNEENHVDYPLSYLMTFAMVRYIKEELDPDTVKAVSIDGLDTFLKMCEYVMKIEDLKVDPQIQIKNAWEWGKRNKRYFDVVELVKSLPCDKYFITHLKSISEIKNGELVSNTTTIPHWHEKINDMMYQKVLMERTKERKGDKIVTTFKATIEKSKSNLALEGASVVVGSVTQQKDSTTYEWSGLMSQIRGAITRPDLTQGKSPVKKVGAKKKEVSGSVEI